MNKVRYQKYIQSQKQIFADQVCENCGKEHDHSYGSGRFCSKRCRAQYVAKHVKTHISPHKGPSPKKKWKCCKCNLTFDTRAQKQKHNKECHSISAWNKGLTKETSPILKQIGEAYHKKIQSGELKPAWLGRKHSTETKNKISVSMKQYFREHPDEAFYKRCHYTNYNYAEEYFKNIFDNAGLTYKKNFAFNGYFLDFAFKNLKIDFEIDGSQHHNDPKIVKHDLIRNNAIQSNGWSIIRIYWPTWQKRSLEDKHKILNILIGYLSGVVKTPNIISY